MTQFKEDAIAVIESLNPARKNFGTGFLIHKTKTSTFWVTCAHVVNDVDGQEMARIGKYSVTVVGIGSREDNDLAVLKVEGLLEKQPLRLSCEARPEDRVKILGYQQAGTLKVAILINAKLTKETSIASANVQSIESWKLDIVGRDLIVEGYSGSPVMNTRGQVTGVAIQKLDEGKRGRMIAISALKEIWPEMPPDLLLDKPQLPDAPHLPWHQISSSMRWSAGITLLILFVRFFGLFESSELHTFDFWMRNRKSEPKDSRILIIEITNSDYKSQTARGETGFSKGLSDRSLIRLLDKLEGADPAAIGLDFYRDKASSIKELDKRLKNSSNLIGVCDLPHVENGESQPDSSNSSGVSKIPEERIGFADILKDKDSIVRRHYLTASPPNNDDCNAKESFSLMLARRYLKDEEDKPYDPPSLDNPYEHPLQIGNIPFQLFDAGFLKSGAYQSLSYGGYYILLNYRNANQVAETVDLEYFLKEYKIEEISNRIVLIGAVDPKIRGYDDNFKTPYGTMPGVILHAHMISQILSAVSDKDKRPLLHVLPLWYEGLWILGWSFTGGILAIFYHSRRFWLFLVNGVAFVVLSFACWFWLSESGLWLPLTQPAFGLVSTSMIVMYGNRVIPR